MRIKELDGLRGISILLVVFFHFYVRWPSLYPYGGQYSDFTLFKYGSYGVEIFFMISGFVILMTLEKTSNFEIFIKKRWLRLFPSILSISLIILLTHKIFHYRPLGEPKLINIIPGITFIEPYWLMKFTKIPFESLEGAFWSLYVEFRFYVIWGACYYFFKKRAALNIILCLSIISFLLNFLSLGKTLNFIFLDVLLGRYLYWFLIGIYTYEVLQGKWRNYILEISLLIVFGLVFGFLKQRNDVFLAEITCFVLFMSVLSVNFVKKIVGSSFFLFMGGISYPLYLFHENAGVSIIIDLGKRQGDIPQFLLPLIALLVVSFISYVDAFVLSSRITKVLKKTLRM